MDEQNALDRQQFLEEPARGFLQQVEQYIDDALELFIFDVYEALVSDYSNVILTLGVLYIVFYVIAIYRGLIRATTEEMFNAVIRLIIVFALLFQFDDFLRLAHSALTNWPDEIIATIVTTVTQSPGVDTAKNTLDLYFDQGIKLGMMIFEKGSLTNPAPWLFGVIAMVIIFLLGVIPLGMALVAKVGIGVLLGITPIFLLFMLFKKTSGFFEAWVRNLMTLVFLKILAFSVMVLSLFILKYPILELKANAIDDELKFSHFIGLFIIGYVLWLFYKHIGGIASSLGSGFVLQTSGLVENYGPRMAGSVKSSLSKVFKGLNK